MRRRARAAPKPRGRSSCSLLVGGALLLTAVSFNLVLNRAVVAPPTSTHVSVITPPSPWNTPWSSPPLPPLPPHVREWASGRNLRGGADALSPDSEMPASRRALVLYVISGDPSEADVANLDFFVRHGMRRAAGEADFVFATYGTLAARWNATLEDYLLLHAKLEDYLLLHLTTGDSAEEHLLAFALEGMRSRGVDLPSYRGLVVVSARMRGPLLPKYAAMLESWPALLLSTLSRGARVAAGSVDCATSAVRFDGSPVAFDMRFLLHAERLGLIGRVRGVSEELSLYARLSVDAPIIVALAHGSCQRAPHPYETMFAEPDPAATLQVYSRWHEERLALPPPPRANEKGKGLIVFAYYEKDASYEQNLRHFLINGVYESDAVDFVIVVNGQCAIEFPELKNLRVMRQENTCFDFGAWGKVLNQVAPKTYSFFIVLNSSIRGPFLPKYWPRERDWFEGVASLLRGDVKLVGLAINCPDGAGRKIPHVMSMLLCFDEEARALAVRHGIFECAADYKTAVRREGDLSRLILEAGFNIDSMQSSYVAHDWRAWFRRNGQTKLVRLTNGFKGCEGVELDIFYKPEWYSGMNPSPMEFMFLKMNRKGFEAQLDEYAGHGSSPPLQGKRVTVFAHSLREDGAPLWLLRATSLLIQQGFSVLCVAVKDGPLRTSFESAGATVEVVELPSFPTNLSADDVRAFLGTVRWHSSQLWLFNTVLWAGFLSLLGPRRSPSRGEPIRVWIMHESELCEEQALPSGAYFGLQFPTLCSHQSPLMLVDRVWWVAEATRAALSAYDFGNFRVVRGFADTVAHLPTSATQQARQLVTSELGVPVSRAAFVVSVVGTVCERKRQEWIVSAAAQLVTDRPSANITVLIFGLSKFRYGKKHSDDAHKYQAKLLEAVRKDPRLKGRVFLLPATPRVMNYVPAADLHVSASTHEAFPLNTLEAMSLGVPVLATPAYGTEEQFRGEDGLLLQNLDSFAEFYSTLLWAYDHRGPALEEIGARGRQTFETHHSTLAAVPRLIAAVEDAVRADARPRVKACVVIRPDRSQSIETLRGVLDSLITQQDFPEWEALLAPIEGRPPRRLFNLLAKLADDRVRIILPRGPGARANASDHLYSDVTDSAIRHCSQSSWWLSFSDGSAPFGMDFLRKLDASFDIVADARHAAFNMRRWIAESQNVTSLGGARGRMIERLRGWRWSMKKL